MTQTQIENWSIGIRSAVAIGVFLILQAVALTWWLGSWSGGIKSRLDAVQVNQDEAKERADDRQAETQARIDQIAAASREREAVIDSRIRPLEAQSAATTATLQAINNSLIQLGADVRDLRKSLEEKRPAR